MSSIPPSYTSQAHLLAARAGSLSFAHPPSSLSLPSRRLHGLHSSRGYRSSEEVGSCQGASDWRYPREGLEEDGYSRSSGHPPGRSISSAFSLARTLAELTAHFTSCSIPQTRPSQLPSSTFITAYLDAFRPRSPLALFSFDLLVFATRSLTSRLLSVVHSLPSIRPRSHSSRALHPSRLDLDPLLRGSRRWRLQARVHARSGGPHSGYHLDRGKG